MFYVLVEKKNKFIGWFHWKELTVIENIFIQVLGSKSHRLILIFENLSTILVFDENILKLKFSYLTFIFHLFNIKK